MATPTHKLYPVAETLFVDQGLNCAAIASQLSITESTLSKWRKAMDWDTKRNAMATTPSKLRELLLKELESVASGVKPVINADAIAKLSKALTYLDGKVSLSVIISVLMELDNWMSEIDPKRANEFLTYHKLFIAHRAECDSLK